MKHNISNNSISQKLKEFDELGIIEPTSEWNRSLLDKLAVTNKQSRSPLRKVQISVAIALIIIVNIGFIVTITNSNNQQGTLKQSLSYQSADRDKELQTLSKELLINPISTND